MTREKLIYRYEHHYFKGWMVRAKREGHRYPDVYFSDKPDGREAALARAKEYRDQLVATLPVAHKLRRVWSPNTTGVIGVARTKEHTRAGNIFVRYVATWPTDADGVYRRVKASFSVALYGEAEAKRQAIRARRDGVAKFLATTKRKWL